MIYIRYINGNDLQFESFTELYNFINNPIYTPSIIYYLVGFGIPSSNSTYVTNYNYYKNKLNIEEIDCSKMYLYNLPIELFSFSNLIKIDCSYNNITKLPKELFSLPKLKILDISYNEIINIPIDIGLLVNLEYFYCFHNNISIMPIEILNCSKLKRLSCDNIINDKQIQEFINEINDNII